MPGNGRPISLAKIYRSHYNRISMKWLLPKCYPVRRGETIGFSINLDDPNDMGGFDVQYDILVLPGNRTYRGTLSVDDGEFKWGQVFGMTVDNQVMQVLVRLKYEVEIWISDEHLHVFEIEKSQVFIFYVEHIGSFMIDYLPISILYNPPFKDMKNISHLDHRYGTIMEFGEREPGLKSVKSSCSLPGGIQVKTPDKTGNLSSSDLSGLAGNTIVFGYDWNSILTADNRNIPNSDYWGALGDIFVILKNVCFKLLHGGKYVTMVADEISNRNMTQVMIVPAHMLLNPNKYRRIARHDFVNDVDAIPADVRGKMLRLDPFINVDDYANSNDHDITEAADQYANPSDRMARAVNISEYILGCGTELDLHNIGAIELGDCHQINKEFLADVTVEKGFDPDNCSLSFLRSHPENNNKRLLRVIYRASVEAEQENIETARCVIVHNTKCEDVHKLRIGWDKIFSTFMFQLIKDFQITLRGGIKDIKGFGIANEEVTLTDKDSTKYKTHSDPHGNYVFNIDKPGEYELRCGGRSKKLIFSKKDIQANKAIILDFEKIKRNLNLEKLALNEFMMFLEISFDTGKSIQQKLSKAKQIDEKIFRQILKDEGLSLADLKRQADIEYPDKKAAKKTAVSGKTKTKKSKSKKR